MAERLAEHGLKLRLPEWDDSRVLKVKGPGGIWCGVDISDEYDAACEYIIPHGETISPAQLASVVARMLSADCQESSDYDAFHRKLTPAAAVWREMEARGMDVTLRTLENHTTCRATTGVVITNPAQPGRGHVHISDDSGGWLYWDTPAAAIGVAATIAAVLSA